MDSLTVSRSWIRPWLAPMLAAVWLVTNFIFFRWTLPGSILSAAVLVILPLTLWKNKLLQPPAGATIGGLVIVMISSLGAVTFIDSQLARLGISLLSAGLIYTLLATAPATPLAAPASRLTVFVMSVSYWLWMFTLYSINIFFRWPIWSLAGLAAVGTAASAAVVWSDHRQPSGENRRRLWLAAWLGLETWLAVWALPTSILVNSVVVTTVIFLWLQFIRHYSMQTWRPERARRYLAVGATVALIVLLTARWA